MTLPAPRLKKFVPEPPEWSAFIIVFYGDADVRKITASALLEAHFGHGEAFVTVDILVETRDRTEHRAHLVHDGSDRIEWQQEPPAEAATAEALIFRDFHDLCVQATIIRRGIPKQMVRRVKAITQEYHAVFTKRIDTPSRLGI